MVAVMFSLCFTIYTLVKSHFQYFKDFVIQENGKLTLKFNVGAKDIILTEPRPVTDGVLHYVVIERKMTNATMRVDDWTIRKTKQGW